MSSKVMFMLGLALVLLGFLISTTMNMQQEMNQLRSDKAEMKQENDTLKAKNAELQRIIANLPPGNIPNTPEGVVCPPLENQAGVAPIPVGFVTALTILGFGRLMANRNRMNR